MLIKIMTLGEYTTIKDQYTLTGTIEISDIITKILLPEYHVFVLGLKNIPSSLTSLSTIIISLVAIIGFSVFFNDKLKIKNFYASFFISLLIISFIQFWGTMFGNYWLCKILTLSVGYILLIYTLIKNNIFFEIKGIFFNRKEVATKQSYSVKSLNVLLMFMPFYFLFLTHTSGLQGYDTFWHGIFSKHINFYGNFWNKESTVPLSHASTLPFFYLLQNFYMEKGIFIERVALFSNNLFIFVGLTALLNEMKVGFLNRFFAIFIFFIIYSMFGHGAFFYLIIEHCMSVTLAFFLYFISQKTDNKPLYITLLCLTPIIILIKEHFIFLIPMIISMGVLVNYGKIFDLKNKKYLMNVVVPLIAIFLLSIFIYFVYQQIVSVDGHLRSPFDIFTKTEKYTHLVEIALKILKASVYNNLIIQGDFNYYFKLFTPISFFGSFVFFIILINGFLLIIKKQTPEFYIYMFVFNIGVVLFYIFLIFTFVFGMPIGLGSDLASYERYSSVFIMGTILFFFVLFEGTTNYKIENKIYLLNFFIRERIYLLFSIILISLFIYNGLMTSRMMITNSGEIIALNRDKTQVRELSKIIKKLPNKNNFKHIAVIFNDNKSLRKDLLLSFYLAPHFRVRMINLNYTFKHSGIYKILLKSDILITEPLSRDEVDRAFGTINTKNISIKNTNICIIDKAQKNHEFYESEYTNINLECIN